MQAKVYSAALLGIEAVSIEVEVDISSGLPSFTIVGLPSQSVDESKDRIRSALRYLGFRIPIERVTINLAPAELKKVGAAYDLPMAIGLLLASDQLPSLFEPLTHLFIGELALDGTLRPVPGILSVAQLAKQLGFTRLYVPEANAQEAALISGLTIFPIHALQDIVLHLRGERCIQQAVETVVEAPTDSSEIDFSFIAGQESVKRGLEIAAAGGHNVLLYGPPGTGKTLLARALPTILPALSREEILEVTQIHSVVGVLHQGQLVHTRPFRAPHHTASHISVVGGGTHPRPGEVSLAHRGVLFFDELPEFSRSVLESLRQPLEDRMVMISRAAGSVVLPANFLFIASSNPCPCGWYGDRLHRCTCTSQQIARYQRKLSGPLLDRIDLHLPVPRVEEVKLLDHPVAESSTEIRSRIDAARAMQCQRYGTSLTLNAHLTTKSLHDVVPLPADSKEVLRLALQTGKLTARSLHKVIRLARTIADLAEKPVVDHRAVLEAIHVRGEALAVSAH